MQKKLFRILSVFLAVVIASVCFMQPMVYANPIAVAGGGALVLLVAGLLISCGMVFTSQAQAEAVASHVLSAVPADLREELDNVIRVNFPDHWGEGGGGDGDGDGGGDPDPKMPKFKSLITGFATTVAVGSALYIKFKTWFDEYFGVDEEVWNGGGGGVGVTVKNENFDGTLESALQVFIDKGFAPLANGTYYPDQWKHYILVAPLGYNLSLPNGQHLNSFVDGNGYPSVHYMELYQGVYYSGTHQGDSTTSRYVMASIKVKSGSYTVDVASGSFLVSTGDFKGHSADGFISLTPEDLATSQTTVAMLQAAWQEAQAFQGVSIPIGITDDMAGMIEKPYKEIIEDYSFENWDYKADLDKLIDMIDGVSSDLDNAKDYGSLLEQYEALQDEVGNLRGVVADHGADSVGGVNPLDDAMYDVAKLLENIKGLIDSQEQDVEIIANLENEIEKAKEAIRELIPDTYPNPDPDPNPNPNPDPDPDPNPNPNPDPDPDPNPNPNPNPDPDPNPNPNPNPDPDPNPNPNPNPDPDPDPNPNPNPNPDPDPDPNPNPNPNPDPDPNPNPNPDPDPDPDPNPNSKINWKPLASIKGFSGVFPFCIPFDIISMISSLKAAPEAPIFEIPFEIKSLSIKEKIIVDLSILNPIMPFVRLFILLAFAVALARFSSSVIKW